MSGAGEGEVVSKKSVTGTPAAEMDGWNASHQLDGWGPVPVQRGGARQHGGAAERQSAAGVHAQQHEQCCGHSPVDAAQR